MKHSFAKVALLALGVVATANAGVFVLDFEGIGQQVPIGDFYNGVGGPDYDISFGPNALALESGNYANNPTSPGIMFFLDGSSIMNVPNGFDTGFSFFYAAAQPGTVNIYSGLNDTGVLLGSFPLPVTPVPYSQWVPVGVAFEGTAHSVDFVGAPDYIGFDNITFGAAVPVENPGEPVPEPSAVIGGLALAGLVARRTFRRK